MTPQERASFFRVISLYICIFSIFHDQAIAKILNFWSLFNFFFKVFGVWNFYANQLAFLGWNNPIHQDSLKSQSEWWLTWVISHIIPQKLLLSSLHNYKNFIVLTIELKIDLNFRIYKKIRELLFIHIFYGLPCRSILSKLISYRTLWHLAPGV